MGKIRIQDLARMMGISNQDLTFKLKSIGVRVEGEDAHIDTDIITAILQGKKLPHPREVILRDEQAPPQPERRRSGGPPVPPPARRPTANPLRPNRPRTLIQRVEPRIQNMPMSERPMPAPGMSVPLPPIEAVAAPVAVEVEAPPLPAPLHQTQAQPAAAVVEVPHPEATAPTPPPPPAPVTPAATASPTRRPEMAPPPRRDGREGQPPREARGDGASSTSRPSGPSRPGDRPGGPQRPGDRPGAPQRPGDRAAAPQRTPDRDRTGGPQRPYGSQQQQQRPPAPGARPTAPPLTTEDLKRRAAERAQEQIARDKKKKGVKKPGLKPAEQEDLTAYKGTLSEIEEDEDALVSGRRSRRAQRRQEEDREEGGKLLTFKKAKPEGPVMIREGMTLREFADKLGVKAKDLMKSLFDRGILASINQVLEPDLAEKLAKDMGVEVMVVSFEEEVQLREEQQAGKANGEPVEGARISRAPVVTIMGHVDHGKTSLLDAIRSSKLTESEFGGITQHIAAYHVDVNGRQVVFLDTPGHEAFTMMRARGARVTDIVVLVVAADDGVMPQTVEAINHAKAAKVPLVVAINKIDKANANPDRVKRELSEQGLQPEDWGGDTVMVPISALRKEGISDLLEMILLTADLLDLRANPEISAQAAVLEARKEVGRGIVATVLVQNGKLRIGDTFVSGATWGRVRSMTDDRGRRVQEAGPSTPVEVTGFDGLPGAGDILQAVQDETQARGIATYRHQEHRDREMTTGPGKLSLAQLFNRIQEGEAKELNVVLKADVQGSLEVLRDAMGKLTTDKVKLNVLHSGVGAISTNDVLLASASNAVIVGFNVRPERGAADLAEKEGIDIRLHTIIYELLDELRKAMTGLLSPTFREVASGRAEVRDTFKVPKVGTIAGCHVVEGVIPRTAGVRLVRDNRVVYEGKIASLRRFKDDVSEVRTGFDCGIGLERFQDVKPGDFIEAYLREEVAPVL